MTVKSRNSLGRNLSALLGPSALLQEAHGSLEPYVSLRITALQPGTYQPRREMDAESLKDLATSIQQQGILQPLLVRAMDEGRYEILAGERRWRAAQLVGLTEVPALVKEVDNQTAMAIALIENLQREDLSALDQAAAMQRLITEFDLTHQQVAELLGLSRTGVSNHLRLLSLSEAVKQLLNANEIDMGHARALIGLSEGHQVKLAELIVARKLSVREAEKLVQNFKENGDKKSVAGFMKPRIFFREEETRLAQHLQATVKIKQKASGQGTVTIHFENADALEKIIQHLG